MSNAEERWIKKQAKKIKKEQGVQHINALNMVVRKMGFANWTHYKEIQKDSVGNR